MLDAVTDIHPKKALSPYNLSKTDLTDVRKLIFIYTMSEKVVKTAKKLSAFCFEPFITYVLLRKYTSSKIMSRSSCI